MNKRNAVISGRGILAFFGVLIIVLAILIGSNTGDLRDRLLFRISPPHIHAIAVLPLENLSGDAGQQFYADGVTRTIIDDMGSLTNVRVIANASASRRRMGSAPLIQIAKDLDVDAVLTGGLLRSGDRVRLNVNLVHAQTNRSLWAQSYESELRESRILQGEMVRDVARVIDSALTPEQEGRLTSRPVNPQAHEAYLRGVVAGQTAQVEQHLKRAIQIDPAHAPAYSSLSYMYYMRNMYPTFAPRDTYPRAREAAQKALGLDPADAGAHNALASVALEYDWNFAEAEKEFKLALKLGPNIAWGHHSYAHYLLAMGRNEEAAAESRIFLAINPLNWYPFACVSWHEVVTGNHGEVEKLSMHALTLGSPDQLVRMSRGWSYQVQRRFDLAIPELQKAVVGWKNAVFPTAALAHAYAAAGQEAAAREVLDRLLARAKSQYVSPYEIAVIYAGLGDRDRAFEWLDKAFEDRSSLLVYWRMDPRIWSLRSDPRFPALLRRMNFPQDRQSMNFK